MSRRFWGTALIVTALVIMMGGCARFEVVRGLKPDGTPMWSVIETSGVPLLSKTGSFEVRHEWLDEATNTLHEVVVTRNIDENADAQAEAFRSMTSLALKVIELSGGMPAGP